MPTRRQTDQNRKFRQDAFASSCDHDRGILGNLVAARCHKITDPEELKILWWLQQASWRDGGLEHFCSVLLNENRGQIGTRTMIELGPRDGGKYSAAEVRRIREEIGTSRRFEFRLRGESRRATWDRLLESEGEQERRSAPCPELPDSYAVADLKAACAIEPTDLADHLRKSLVDPASESIRAGLWNFPHLWDALCRKRTEEATAAAGRIVPTSATRTISEELDFARESRSFILIEGREGIGKSEAVRAWCDSRPGEAVYVRIESGTDETSFFRSIARALGTACSYTHTAVQMRARIEDALQAGHLMLVLDEAHFLWPMNERTARCTPRRIEWLRTAIIDFDVPVALVSTPQFFTRQCDRYRRFGWNANQIQRRLARTAMLPEVLENADVLAVARKFFPDFAEGELTKIAFLAMLSLPYLTTIVHVRKRLDFLAARSPSQRKSDILASVLAELQLAETGQQVTGTALAGSAHSAKRTNRVAATAPTPGAQVMPEASGGRASSYLRPDRVGSVAQRIQRATNITNASTMSTASP